MKTIKSLAWVWVSVLLAGCAAFNTAGLVQSGRRALLVNDPELALPYFLQAAQADPNYVYHSVYFREGIWTYVGRAQYATKRYAEARQSLERALSLDPNDHLARLYLGLTLVRTGDRARGIKEIRSAMRGIYDWLEYINASRPFEAYWDPLREIRKAIEIHLVSGLGDDAVNTEQLIADAEWLGNKMEDEIERVREDERRQYERDFDRRRGPSLGVGIGF
jgi:tetratricopeptide (TPR) repeat protein